MIRAWAQILLEDIYFIDRRRGYYCRIREENIGVNEYIISKDELLSNIFIVLYDYCFYFNFV